MIIDEALLKNMLIEAWAGQSDPSHDLGHVERVVNMAKLIGGKEEGDLSVIVPAAWLHDCINLPKNHKDRKLASRKSADYATEKLSAHIMTRVNSRQSIMQSRRIVFQRGLHPIH